MDGPRRWVPVGSAVGALLFAATATAVSRSATTTVWWRDLVLRGFGAVLILAGLGIWLRARSPRVGQLVLVAGACYYLGDLRVSEQPVVFAIGFCLAYVWTAVLGHLVLVWPSGQLTGRPVRVLVAACYLAAAGTQVVRYLVDRPTPPWWYGIHNTPTSNTVSAKVGSLLLVALVVVVVVVVVRRWAVSTRLRRRPSAPVWAAFLLGVLLALGPSIASAINAPVSVELSLMLAGLGFGLMGVLVAMVVRWARAEAAQWVVAKTVLAQTLESQSHPGQLQEALARALGDPTLRLAYPLPDGSYVDIEGRPVEVRPDLATRVVTPVSRGGTVFGLIEHDEALNEQRKVADAAVTVAGQSIENAFLYARLRAEVKQVRISRLRLSIAEFEERRRIQRDLHDSAQQPLFAVLVQLNAAEHALADDGDGALTAARAKVRQAHAQLEDAIKSIRELTQGIYPTVLIEHGLAAAVEGLADQSTIPVAFDVPDQRWPRRAEIVAYFVIAEAITNVRKHTAASRIDVAVDRRADRLVVEISDDGPGGVDPDAGTGLRGLRDRVEAEDGTLTVISVRGHGTRIIADIPAAERITADIPEEP